MRILVVGTIPPPGGDGARRLAAVVGELVAGGHEVEVLSPDGRSAAHRHAHLDGPLLALHLARFASRYDVLVLRIEAGLPLSAQSGRFGRTVALASLGLALRLWGEVTIRIDSPMPVPGGIGGRATRLLWSRATSIVVANNEDKVSLLRAPGVVPERVVIDSPPELVDRRAERGWVFDAESSLREEILGVVRARAARERAVNSARIELGASGVGPDGVSAFSALDWPSSSALGVARIAIGKARRLFGTPQSREKV